MTTKIYTPDDLYDMFANQASPTDILMPAEELAADIRELDTDGAISDYTAAAQTIIEMALAHLEQRWGTVTHDGLTVWLTSQAVSDNYGTEGLIRYYAPAVDAEGTPYQVAWDTTDEWDLACELDRIRAKSDWTEDDETRYDELRAMPLPDPGDESNACDWANPAYVRLH